MDSEQSAVLWFVFLALPFDVLADRCFIETHGRRKIPNAPDAVFFEVDIANELEPFAELLARD